MDEDHHQQRSRLSADVVVVVADVVVDGGMGMTSADVVLARGSDGAPVAALPVPPPVSSSAVSVANTHPNRCRTGAHSFELG